MCVLMHGEFAGACSLHHERATAMIPCCLLAVRQAAPAVNDRAHHTAVPTGEVHTPLLCPRSVLTLAVSSINTSCRIRRLLGTLLTATWMQVYVQAGMRRVQ